MTSGARRRSYKLTNSFQIMVNKGFSSVLLRDVAVKSLLYVDVTACPES